MLVVAAYECRSVTGSVLTPRRLRQPRAELDGGWPRSPSPSLVTQMDLFNRLLDTTPLTAGQFLLALASAVLLLVAVGARQARRAA